MVWVSSWGWQRWLEANLGRRPTTSRGGAGGEMGDGQGGRWRPREDAKDGNGDAAWVVASSRRPTPPESGSAALLEVGGRKKFW